VVVVYSRFTAFTSKAHFHEEAKATSLLWFPFESTHVTFDRGPDLATQPHSIGSGTSERPTQSTRSYTGHDYRYLLSSLEF